MSSILVVRVDRLDDLPEGVCRYVLEYGLRRSVLGIACLVFERHVLDPGAGGCPSWRRGLAPSHSVDLDHYGREAGTGDVNEWLRKNAGRGIFEEFGTTERSSATWEDD